jgi:hypothetical protein
MFYGDIFYSADEFGLVAAGNGNCFGGTHYSWGRIIHWFVDV